MSAAEFRLPSGVEVLRLKVIARPRVLNAEERALAERAALTLRVGIESLDPAALETAQALDRALLGSLPRSSLAIDAERRPEPSLQFTTFARELAELLARELSRGKIVVERVPVPSLTEAPPLELPDLPSAPPPARESPLTFFDVRIVDEVGQAVNGLAVDFTVNGAVNGITTNAAGVALLENVEASAATVTPTDVVDLDEILDPRWTTERSGSAPKVGNSTALTLEERPLAPIAVKPALPHTVVVAPPRGCLFVQLFDKSGRVRHGSRAYKITGPRDFSGTTDALGLLRHDAVFPGDYTLELTLEFFEGDDKLTSTFSTPLVVLPAAAAEPETRQIGVVPFSVLARLHLFFNTNKTFLLPTALPGIKKLRSLYLANNPGELLVVGHADTTGGPDFNDRLSLERADATIAFLKDDVDVWLRFYEDSVPKTKRWGAAEDRMMLVSLPDFSTKPKGEDAVRWFQRTRSLQVDGKAGPETRRQLITEYMDLDEATLDAPELKIEATAHGCGENFPLDESAEELDEAPEDAKRDPIDRRVELFFFDPEFGIAPKPASQNSGPGSPQYPLWRKSVIQTVDIRADELGLPLVTFVEILDGLFRSDSAVVLPEAEAPATDETKPKSLSSVGLFAAALRFAEEHPEKKVFVAGHADTTNTTDFNQKLSEERARAVLALLLGGDEQRELWKSTCDGRHQVSDYKQILAWVTRAFPDLDFDCDPGRIDDNEATGVEPVRRFQNAYNRNKAALGATGPDLAPDGDVGPLTWGAIFDCYEAALREELGENAAGVKALRDRLSFVDPARRSLGFSEFFPVEELGVDNFKSQANRRAEVLFFDPGEEPDLAAAENDPETSELYLPGRFQRTPIEPMLSAKPFVARWDATTSNASTSRTMTLSAPGIPAGEPFVFTLQVNGEPLRIFDVVSSEGGASLVYEDWEEPELIDPISLEANGVFPPVVYDFSVEGGGRLVTSKNQVTYADRIFVRLEIDPSDGDPVVVLANEKYVLQTPWGERQGQTDAAGLVDEKDVPPGGAALLLRGRHLIHLGTLPHNWDADA